MAIKKILLVASFLLLLLSTHANTAYFKHLSVQDGLSQVNIISIYQDETGALWFGSFEGINRYNGQSVTVFHPSQDNIGLTENEIMAICGNKKGNVYIQALHVNPEKPYVPLNKNDAFQKVQKRRVQKKR